VKCHQCNTDYYGPDIKDSTAYFVCLDCGHCYEVENYHGFTKEQIIERIEKAFSGVVLGNGVGLWQAQAIDDYEAVSEQKRARLKDEKEQWSKLSGAELQRCHSSLSFFDADGMRFHLPAFIIESIKGEVDDPLFHLSSLDEYGTSKFESMSLGHKKAVSEYLIWCLTKDEYTYEQHEIRKALQYFWEIT